MYYQVKVGIKFEADNGNIKTKNEVLLIDADTCTEAEAKVYKDFEKTNLDWEVKSISQSPIVKVIE